MEAKAVKSLHLFLRKKITSSLPSCHCTVLSPHCCQALCFRDDLENPERSLSFRVNATSL